MNTPAAAQGWLERLNRRVDVIRRRVDVIHRRVDVIRQWPWLETGHTLLARFREDRLGQTAGSLTFTTVISLVPLLTVALALFTAFPMFAQFQGALERYLFDSLVPPTVARNATAMLTQFAQKASRLGAAGLIVLLVSAIALMLTIDRALNAIWRVQRPRPLPQRVLVYWAAATLGPLLLGVSLSASAYLFAASKGVAFAAVPKLWLVLLIDLFEITGFALALGLLYRYVPNTSVAWRDALLGGLTAALAFELAKRGFGWYVKAVPTYGAIYGAFASVPIFLLWVYASWLIVLFGAVVAAYAPSLRLRIRRVQGVAGGEFALALAVLRALRTAQAVEAAQSQVAKRGLTLAALSKQLHVDPLEVDAALTTLMALDWVARLSDEDEPRHVLICNPAATAALPLVRRLLLAPELAVGQWWQQLDFQRLTLAELL
jgi:membrane protein